MAEDGISAVVQLNVVSKLCTNTPCLALLRTFYVLRIETRAAVRGYGDPHAWRFAWVWAWDGYRDTDGLMGILLGLLNRCEVQWTSVKHGVNVIVDV